MQITARSATPQAAFSVSRPAVAVTPCSGKSFAAGGAPAPSYRDAEMPSLIKASARASVCVVSVRCIPPGAAVFFLSFVRNDCLHIFLRMISHSLYVHYIIHPGAPQDYFKKYCQNSLGSHVFLALPLLRLTCGRYCITMGKNKLLSKEFASCYIL